MFSAWQTVGVCVALTCVVILVDLLHSAGWFKGRQASLAGAARQARAKHLAQSDPEGGSQ